MNKKETCPNSKNESGMLDEMEQLRTALESALEENSRLVEDRDRLRHRLTLLAQELQAIQVQPSDKLTQQQNSAERHSQTEEELRVAFEELQVLTEELEVANGSLQLANQELDAKVAESTRQWQEANAALRTTEQSLRAITDLVPDLLWRMDGDGQADWFNWRWFDYTGHEPSEPMAERWMRAIHPLDRTLCATAWAEAVSTGASLQEEVRLQNVDGDYRWTLVRVDPMRDDRGNIVNWFAAGTDVHERRTAMEAVQQTELRFRTLIEGMPQLVWRAIGAGNWTWCSPQWTAFTGQDEQASLGMGWLEMVHPDDRAMARESWGRADEQGQLDFEGRILCASEGRHRHFRTRALPVRRKDGTIIEWLGTSTDLDDIWQLQQQQSVLVSELQHRTRNLMAIVRSIATRTLNGSKTLEEFRECFDDRMAALARVQSLLSRREGALRVSFDALLREELSAHVRLDDPEQDQVFLEGPANVQLRSSIVQTFALAIHELATNAVKHGALSRPGPQLHVRWDLKKSSDDADLLCVDWRESGVPGLDATASAHGNGYGRELIEKALPYQLGASTTYAIEADGVHCTIEMALPIEPDELEAKRD